MFINGLPVSCQFDFNTPHLKPNKEGGIPPCYTHLMFITFGSSTVKINGRGCGRVTDGVFLCTFVLTGMPNVIVG